VLRKGGVFHVRPATPGPIVDLADVRRHLTIRDANAARDEQLADFLDAATDLAEDFTGRTYRRQVVVETYDGGRDVIGLYQTPVQSVTALTENGVTLPSTNYVVDLTAGTVQRGTLYGPGLLWLPGLQNITVTYVAGPSVLKARVRLGVLELTRHLWETQRGGSNQPRQAGSGDDWDPRSGYAIPHRVAELLQADMAPGF
jgi:hypothetical protein